MKEKIVRLRQRVRPYLTEARYRHTLCVEKEIAYLAEIYCKDKLDQLCAAALLHDIGKKMSAEEQLAYCEENGLPITKDERLSPPLLHAKIGAHLVKKDFEEFASEEVLSAIEKHTTADEEMSLFDSLLYLADFTEESRTYEDCVALRRMLHEGLECRRDAADRMLHLKRVLLRAYELSLLELVHQGRVISPKTVLARNSLLANLSSLALQK